MVILGDVPGQGDLFAAADVWPEGFAYCGDVISPKEEQHFAEQFAMLPLAPFEFHGFRGRRRVLSFGWRYDFDAHRLRISEEIPSFLLPLRDRAAEMAGIPGASLQQVLVSEYAPGAAIGWHFDKAQFEDVIALSFLAPCMLKLRRRREQGWDRQSIEIMPRSAYILRGPARREWQHCILPVGELRYSVTFRSLVGNVTPTRQAG
jgi:alkylated DNA repair dioxygenase AlkB